MPTTLDTIVELQKTITELAAADQRLNTIPEWMSELHEEHSQRQTESDAVVETAEVAERERREAEAAVSDSQEKLKHYQEQIGKVSTQHEYGALLKEIDTVKEQIRASEQQALEAMARQEESMKQSEALHEGFHELDEQYQTELAKWESEKPAVTEVIQELSERREELRTEVPRNLLMLFDRILERYDGQALSRVRMMQIGRGNAMWHCEACSYNVRPQIVVEIKGGDQISQCDSCKRILYWGEED